MQQVTSGYTNRWPYRAREGPIEVLTVGQGAPIVLTIEGLRPSIEVPITLGPGPKGLVKFT